jgi:hypothetical protein
MSDDVRTCVTCKHSELPQWVYGSPKPTETECKHPNAASRDLVYGRTTCQAERNMQGRKGCGPVGRLWEKKDK